MLEPDQWDAVLSRIAGTIYRGTERISSNALLNALQVVPDPVIRQKVIDDAENEGRDNTGCRVRRVP